MNEEASSVLLFLSVVKKELRFVFQDIIFSLHCCTFRLVNDEASSVVLFLLCVVKKNDLDSSFKTYTFFILST